MALLYLLLSKTEEIAKGFNILEIMEIKPLQPLKAELPILVTPLPMVTDVRPLQPLKALKPMLVTLLGMVTDVRPLQFQKASSPMLITLLGMMTEVAQGLHFTTVVLLINKPSFVSSSHRVAPQLLLSDNEELLTNESYTK